MHSPSKKDDDHDIKLNFNNGNVGNGGNAPAWGRKMTFYLFLAFVAGVMASMFMLSCLVHIGVDPIIPIIYPPPGGSLGGSPGGSPDASSARFHDPGPLAEPTLANKYYEKSSTTFAFYSPKCGKSCVRIGAEYLKNQSFETINLQETSVLQTFFSSGIRPTKVVYLTDFQQSIPDTLSRLFDFTGGNYVAAWNAKHSTQMALRELANEQRLELMVMYDDEASQGSESFDEWICPFLTDYMSLFYPQSDKDHVDDIDRNALMPSLTFLDISPNTPNNPNNPNSAKNRLEVMSLNAMHEKFDLERCNTKEETKKEPECDCTSCKFNVKARKMQVINLGIHKSGSTTLHELFKCMGLRSLHWKVHFQGQVAASLLCADNGTNCSRLPRGLFPLREIGYNAVAQMDTRGSYPQIPNFKQIIESNPDAFFIISIRNQSKHIESMKHWTHLYEILANKAKEFNAIPMFPNLLDTWKTEKHILNSTRMDYNFELWLLRYHYQVMKYFVQHPQYKWTLFDLDQDPKEMKTNLENFFGCKKLAIGWANKRNDTLKGRNSKS